MLSLNRTYVLKTHKGEQVMEDRIAKVDSADIIPGLGADSTSEEQDKEKEKTDKEEHGDRRDRKHSKRDRDRRSSKDRDKRSGSKERKSSREHDRKDSKRRRSRSRDRYLKWFKIERGLPQRAEIAARCGRSLSVYLETLIQDN